MGRHIIFEGLDGAGKSTAIGITKEWLEEAGRTVWTTDSPSYHPVGTLTKSYFHKALKMFPDDKKRAAFMGCLLSADMLEHDLEIRKKLEEEEGDDLFVLQSRTWMSTYCYQAKSKGMQMFLLDEIRPQLCVPNAVVFVYADVNVCMERIQSRDKKIVDMYETKGMLQQVLDHWNFLGKYMNGIHVLSIDTTHITTEETLSKIQDFLSRWGLVHGD